MKVMGEMADGDVPLWSREKNPEDGPRHRSGTYVFASRSNARPVAPFLCRDIDFAYHSFGIDPDRVAPFIPAGMALTEEAIGFSAMCVVGDAWSLGAFTWSFGGVVVDNYESPDGSEGGLILFSYVSPAAHSVFAGIHDGRSIAGPTRVWDQDGMWWAEAGPEGKAPHVRIASRVTSDPVTIDGIDRYLSTIDGGLMVDWTVSYAGTSRIGDLVVFDVADHAPAALKAMTPTQKHWGARNTEFAATFSAPHLVRPSGSAGALAAERAFLTLLGERESPAVVVDADMRVAHMNGAARTLIGASVSRNYGYLRSVGVAEQHRLENAVLETAVGVGKRTPFRLDLGDGRALIAEAFPLDPVLFGPARVLLFVTDPKGQPVVDAFPSLRLLGLTTAEARIGSLVGSGLSPVEAATRLELATGTVRSTLKRVFDKLGVSRQAELAALVTRLKGGA